jgi:hypothetical protein
VSRYAGPDRTSRLPRLLFGSWSLLKTNRRSKRDQDFGLCAVTVERRFVLVLDDLRFGRAAVLRLSNGSCQCLMMIVFIFFESDFGSVAGNAIAIDAIDLTSGVTSFLCKTSSLSAFPNASLWSSGSACGCSDESATLSVRVTFKTSAFVTGTPAEAFALEKGAMPILTATIVPRPTRQNRASQTVLIGCGARARSCLLACSDGIFPTARNISVELRRLEDFLAALHRKPRPCFDHSGTVRPLFKRVQIDPKST